MIKQNIQITFSMREDVYFQFKDCCMKEKRKPANVIREMITNYIIENYKTDLEKDNKDN